MSDQHESRVGQIPIFGTVHRELQERGPFGLLLFVGVSNLGAALGTTVAHGDPWWPYYVAFWLVTGLLASGYAILGGGDRDE